MQSKLVKSLWQSGTWRPENEGLKESLIAHVDKEAELPGKDVGESDDDYITGMGFEDYPEEVGSWIAEMIDLTEIDTVAALATQASKVPLAWHDDLAYLTYEDTRALYYAIDIKPYVPPFKALIKDVDDGNIDEFHYERKYGNAATGNLGAEFNVERPSEKKQQYVGKAVLHTHYPAANHTPHYGHTKPEDKKYAAGFGYTVVEIGKLLAVDDTRKSYNAL